MRFSNNIPSAGANATAAIVFLGTFFRKIGTRRPESSRIRPRFGRKWLAADKQKQTGQYPVKGNRVWLHYSRYTQNKVLLSVPCVCAREGLFVSQKRMTAGVAALTGRKWLAAGNQMQTGQDQVATNESGSIIQGTLKTRYF